MNEVKVYKKKFTNAGGGTCFLAFMALLFAGLGCGLEALAKLFYGVFFDGHELEFLFSNDWAGYIEYCMPSITAAVITLVYFIGLISSRKKMSIGSFATVLTIFIPVALIISPSYNIVQLLNNDTFMESIKHGGALTYEAVCGLLVYALPALSLFFMLLSGLALAGRLVEDSIVVDIPLRSNIDIQAARAAQNNQPYVPVNNGYSNVNDHNAFMPEAEPILNNQQVLNNAVIPDNNEPKAEEAFAPIVNDNIVQENNAASGLDDQTKAEPANTDTPVSEQNISDIKICSSCFARLKPNAKFCPSCGAKVSEPDEI